jgi:WD40 repeat protein
MVEEASSTQVDSNTVAGTENPSNIGSVMDLGDPNEIDVPKETFLMGYKGKKIDQKYQVTHGESEIYTLKYDPTDKYVACGCGDGKIRIFHTDDGHLKCEINANGFGVGGFDERPITNLRWKTENVGFPTLVSASSDGFVKYWHINSGRCLYQAQETEDNHLAALDFNKGCSHLATAGSDKIIRIYDEETKSLVMSMKEGNGLSGHSNRVFCVKFDPVDPNILYSAGWDKTL